MSSDLQVQASGPARLDLPRVLGAADVVGIVLGTVIGSGIFIVPATIAAQVGSPLLIMAVWVTGGVLSFLGALSFAELGAAFPQAGGVYVYLREAYGELVAFLFGWTLFFVIDSGAIATLSVAFSSKYLPYFIAMSPAATKVVALCLIAFLTTVNGLGVKWGAGLQNLLTLIKFAAIVGVSAAVFLFARGNAAHFVTPAPAGFSPGLVGAFGMALVASLWAYKGWEVATYSAGEVKHPERNLPLGLFVGTSLAIVLYVAANLAYLYVFPAGELAKSSRIAADAMNAAVGAAGASIVAFVILLSITGAANGNFLTAPRVLQTARPRAPAVPDAAHGHRRDGPLGGPPQPVRDFRGARQLRHLRAVDLLRLHGRCRDRPEAQAARAEAALPHLGVPGHPGALHPRGALHRGRLARAEPGERREGPRPDPAGDSRVSLLAAAQGAARLEAGAGLREEPVTRRQSRRYLEPPPARMKLPSSRRRNMRARASVDISRSHVDESIDQRRSACWGVRQSPGISRNSPWTRRRSPMTCVTLTATSLPIVRTSPGRVRLDRGRARRPERARERSRSSEARRTSSTVRDEPR
jgi:L-asparagine transporter-like permease